MNRTLLLLVVAIIVCAAMSVVAFLLKLTFALGLIVVAGVGVLVLGGWLMLRSRKGPYG